MKRRLIPLVGIIMLVILVGILVLVMTVLPSATSIPAMATSDTLTLQPNGAGDYVVCTDYYLDEDDDGYGVTGNSQCLEFPADPYDAEMDGDCDDTDPAINPDAAEVCDGQDNDCDTLVDGDDADFVPLQIQLAMILDGSGSIEEYEWDIMIGGLAAAVEDSQCVPQDGTVELTVIQFGDGQAQLEIGPVVITAANAGAVAAQIQGIGQIGGWTPMACGIYLAADTLAASPCFSTDLKQVINLVTDGEPNRCCDGYTSSACPQEEDAFDSAEAAREYAITTLGMTEGQDEIDAEFMGSTGDASNWLRDSIVYPQPGYYAPEFNGGGWVRVIANVDDFATTICEKFTVIVCDDDNPCTIDTYDGEQCVFTPIETETICDDEIDNDCDGYIDCDDEEDCACSTCSINVQTDPKTHATFYIYDITAGNGTYGPTDPGWISNGDYLESYHSSIPCGHCYQVWVTKPGLFYTVKKSGLSGQAGPAHDNWCCEYAPVAYGCTTSGTYNVHFEAGAGCPEEECLTLETQTIISDEDTMVTAINNVPITPQNAVLAWVHSNWTTDLDYAFLSGAQWIWETEYVVHPQAGDVVSFERTVTIPSDATSIVGAIYITCDNGYEVWLNGSFVGSAQVHDYGDPVVEWQNSDLTENWVNSSGWQSVESYNISDPLLAPGENTFVFECANEQMEGGTTSSNPGGLIFEIQIAYCTSTCDDGIDCTIDSCDPKTGECIHTPVDAYCDDGAWCNGAETCDPVDGCQSGTAPDCSYLNDQCNVGVCNEDAEECQAQPANEGQSCDDGTYCNGPDTCQSGQCLPSDGPVDCDDGVACTTDSCNESTDSCDHTPVDAYCDDGAWCNGAEYCDEELGCMDGTPPDCDDDNACTQDWCNEENDTCQHRNICVTGGGGLPDTACYLWVDMLGEIYRVEMKCCPNESIEYHKCLDPDELHFIEIEEDMEIICGDCAGACTDDPKDCTDCQMCRAFPKVIVMSLAEESPDPPDGTVVVGSVYYDFTGYKDTKRLIECEIATFFYPEISILVSFDPETIPPGGFGPYLAWYDAELGVWNPLPSDPDKLAGVGQVTGLTNTFASTFAVLVNVPAPEPTPVPEPVVPEPAHFVVSDLSITPKESKTGETVTISVNVTNDGEEEGTYLVELMINGQIAKDAEVTLGAGQSEEVTFAVSAAEPGQYEVVVSGLSGEFTVVGAINWWLWGSIIAAVILFAAWLFWYRRRRMRAEPAS